MSPSGSDPQAVLAAYGLQSAAVSPLGKGLINRTFLVSAPDGRCFVLQQVNALFPPSINEDIDVVTRHIAAKGLSTPRLLRTGGGGLHVDRAGETWRLLTRIDGVAHEVLQNTRQAAAAGAMLARFHHAVADLQHEFHAPRPGVHDTAKHLAALREALSEHKNHPQFARIAGLGDEILAAAERLPELPVTAPRIVHGDPKISNFIFAPDSDQAICLVDLDTITRMPLSLELGDAFRSWCNPAGEDAESGMFSPDIFRAAVNGYLDVASGWILPQEAGAIVAAIQTILIELAARFCADALDESYFGWDPERFPTRSEHNRVRAAGQLAVARSLAAQKQQAEDIVRLATGEENL